MLRRFPHRLSIRNKLLTGFSLVIIMLGVFSLYFLRNTGAVQDSIVRADREYEHLSKVAQLALSNTELADSVKALIISRDKRWEDVYDAASVEFDTEIAELRNLETDAGELRVLAEFESLSNRLKGTELLILSKVREGDIDRAADLFDDKYQELQKSAAGILAEVVAEETEDVARAIQRAESSLTSMRITLAIMLVALAASVAAISLFLANLITSPVKALLGAAQRISAGDLGARAELSTGDEIGLLGTAFNEMAKRLWESHHNLELQVADRTQELSQANSELELQMAETSRKEVEIRRLALAVSNTGEGVCITDLDGRIEFVNPALLGMLGYEEHEIVGTSLNYLLPRGTGNPIFQQITQGLQEGRWTGEVELQSKCGGLIPTLQHATAMRDETDILTGYVCISTNISERKQTEHALARHAEELARSNEDLEQFAYAASHDLQEPLRAIAGFTKLLARRYRNQSDPDPDNLVARTINAATRMQAAINDLLAYSRVGRDVEAIEPADTGAIVDQVIDDLGASIEETGAVVTHDSLPTVMVDKSLLGQVYGNLIGNAIKFHGQEPPRVHVSAELAGKEWVLSVRDNGMGIDSQYAERIFVIFQRLHTREEYPGTGIGLAICKKAVERVGGRIWVDSKPGAGSTFYFTVPAGDSFEAGLTSPAPVPAARNLAEAGSL